MPKILKMICHLLHIAAKTAKFGFFRYFPFLFLAQNSLQFGGLVALVLQCIFAPKTYEIYLLSIFQIYEIYDYKVKIDR